MRIAFFDASATSTSRPTCVRMLLSNPRRFTPRIAARIHIGTMRITASGSVNASY
jgi:hypothetical protein